MRKILAALLALVAVAALVGLIASLAGVQVGAGGRPMLFARALVLSLALLLVTMRWRRRGGRMRG